MSAAPSPSRGAGAAAIATARALLGEARQAGLVLELEADGRVRFEATRGPPPPELLARLRAHKAELAALLAAERDRAPDPTAPLLALLEAGEPKAAADMLAEAARVWLDPWTWQELADLARTGPDRCRPALAAVLARDMAALDALLGERAPVAPAEPPRPEPPYPSGAAAPELPELDPLAARRLARAAELVADGTLALLEAEAEAWIGPERGARFAAAARAIPRGTSRAAIRAALRPLLDQTATAAGEPGEAQSGPSAGEVTGRLAGSPTGSAAALCGPARRRVARFAGGYVRTLRSHWRAWAPDRTAELERAIAELRGCTDRERAERVFAAALLGDPA